MRRTLLAGLLIAVAVFVTMFISGALDLELESFALLGLTVGAVVALVPDATPSHRLGGYAVGFVVTVLGYLFRAALTPDTTTGRAVAAFVIVALCVGVIAATLGRLPLWAGLVGVASVVGAFESIYDAAPTLVVTNVISTCSALLMCVAVGFVAAVFVTGEPRRKDVQSAPTHDNDHLMETAR
jgi:hypothetical protein